MSRQRIVPLARKALGCFCLFALGILLHSERAIGQPPQPPIASPASTPAADPKDLPSFASVAGSANHPAPLPPDLQPGGFHPCTDVEEDADPSGAAVRFGWWQVHRRGNPWVIGQWQSTDSSPFFDVDGLWTNGNRTLNYTITGTDNESTRANIQYFGPRSEGFVDVNRFIHANEHESFDNMAAASKILAKQGQPVIPQDVNKGQDYAMRIEQYETQYKFDILGDRGRDDLLIKGKINVWDQREFGDRQSNNTVHCFTAQSAAQQKSCHILSVKQGIDWNTFEVTPTLEARYGPVNIQYSHTLRTFSASDDPLIGTFTDGGANIISGQFPFAVVPESLFNMDKIKMGIDVNPYNHIYAYGYIGKVENHDRDVARDLGGFDARWTNTAFKGLNLTTYLKNYDQSADRPTTFLPDETQGLSKPAVLASIRDPIGFNRYTAGEKFNWRPWAGDCDSMLGRISVTGGYEYDHLIRVNERWSQPLFPPSVVKTTPILFQPNTDTNSFNIGLQNPWSDEIHTYIRYKVSFIQDDLVGFRQTNGAVNSSLADNRHAIEFGAEWFPSRCFGAAFNQLIELSSRLHGTQPVGGPDPRVVGTVPGDILNFGEDSYSTSLTSWYRPVDRVILTANADYFTNWIKQNITIGDDYFLPGDPLPLFSPVTGKWSYGGTAVELGFGGNYQLSRTVILTSDYQIVFGKDVITNSDGFATLAQFPTVRNVTQQIRAGIDWKPREHMVAYFRYEFTRYEDRTDTANTGTLNMFLAGLTYRW